MRTVFKIFVLFIGLLVISTSCFGQKVEKAPKVPDSTYIISYPQLITVGVFFASPIMELSIKPVNKGLDKYKSDFRGNFSDQVGVNLAYRKLSLSFGIKTPFGPKEDSKKGRTTNTGITLKFKKPNFNLTAEYRQYTGVYDNNSPNYDPKADTAIVRPDIRYKNIGINVIYNFSWKKYSYNSPLTFSERQLKSRIGLLAKAGLNYTTISSSDSTLLYGVQTDQFTAFDDVRAINALLLKVGPGVGANIVFFRKFYISLNYFLMGNFIGYTYDVTGKSRSHWALNANAYTETAAGIGYNSRRLYGGINFNGDINIMHIRSARVRTNFAQVYATLGYRFTAPRAFSRFWDKTLTRYLKL